MKILFIIYIFCSFNSLANAITIIVNKKNPVSSITMSSLQNIYLMNINLWLNNEKIQIVDYKTSNSRRITFSQTYLNNLSPYRVSKYWIRASLGGKSTPPLIIESEEEIINFIKRNNGAIGYVDENFKLPDFVKKLSISKDE